MEQKNILITGARSFTALELARQMNSQGQRIFVADSSKWYLTRFSNTIEKAFTVASARFESELFAQDIARIVAEEKIDLIIPSFEEVFYLAKCRDRLPTSCQLFTESLELLLELHDKNTLIKKLDSFGLPTPITTLIKDPEDLKSLTPKHSYALKPVFSRAATKVIKFTPGDTIPTLDITENNPWLAQEWLEGQRFCTYSVCHNGKITANAIYPVQYSIDDYSCLYFEAVQHPEILEWLRNVAAKLQFTGQIAFDIIVRDNTLYAIDCNPRATSGLHLFSNEDQITEAFFNPSADLIEPQPGAAKQIAIAMLMYGHKTSVDLAKPEGFFKTWLKTNDVIYSKLDKKPFVMQFWGFVHYWGQALKLRMRLPEMFYRDLEWNGEL